jgi:hypothetical protein
VRVFETRFSSFFILLEIKLNRDGSMSIKKDISQLNSVFQIGKIIKGKEEKVKFK